MSDEFAVRLDGVGKMYKLFSSRTDNFLDAVGLGRLPGRRVDYREFWALRGVDFELRRGERVGVIGRNGAGKTTLLKLITRNLLPTEGSVTVNGQVQALLEAGAGFHPDFTGHENVRAALTYQGFTTTEIDEAEAEIAHFTELGEFLDQPFKTYSSGMQARLAFATATTVRPEILIVDELLGAGDAYFISRSSARMRALVDSGASILLVSHSLEQVTQLCEKAIWLERGEVVMAGASLDVIKAYERFIRQLEDRLLQARNVRRATGAASLVNLEEPTLSFAIRFVAGGAQAGNVDVGEIRVRNDGATTDTLHVGAPQDASSSHPCFVDLEHSQWSAPLEQSNGYYRQLRAVEQRETAGLVKFDLLAAVDTSALEVEVEYRTTGDARGRVELVLDGEQRVLGTLESTPDWSKRLFPLEVGEGPRTGEATVRVPDQGESLSRWPGEGSLRIERVDLLDGLGRPRAVFQAGEAMSLRVHFTAVADGTFALLPVAVVYRVDGINVTTQLGEWVQVGAEMGQTRTATLEIGELNLGNANYVISIALYKRFDPTLNEASIAYDWVDRSLEFQVVGGPPAITSLFLHPSRWTVE